MEHLRIIRRAFDITRVYRALWIFGILLALTAGGNASTSSYSFNERDFQNSGNWRWPPNWNFDMPSIPGNVTNTIIGGVIALICVGIVLAIAFAILRYVSATTLVRMVSGYEAAGERVKVREGFRLGWSRGAFRYFLIDLFFGIAGFFVVVLSLALVAAPLLLWTTGNDTAGAIGTVLAIGLFILWLLVVIAAAAALTLVVELAYRAVILEGRGVFDGIGRGWALFRSRLGDNIIMGLILFGIKLAVDVLMIPVFILLLLAGGVVGGIPALLGGALTSLFAEGATPAIIAAIIGVPILLAVLLIPLLFVGGLFETFKSSVWTLTFRELLALESTHSPAPAAPAAPAPILPAAPAAPATPVVSAPEPPSE